MTNCLILITGIGEAGNTNSMTISKKELNTLFEYREGILYNRYNRSPRAREGKSVGSLTKAGYIETKLLKVRYYIHRLIWIYHNGEIPEGLVIDHINRVKSDNRIENLRLVTEQENSFNKNVRGTSWDASRGLWVSNIGLGGCSKFLGRFNTEEEAHQAYISAKKIYHVVDDISRPVIINKVTQGFCWRKDTKKYRAYIVVDGKMKHLGQYNTAEEARNAHLEAKSLYKNQGDK